jgi:hypothetical protein
MGARVTLVYKLRRGDAAFLNMFSYKMPTTEDIAKRLREAIQDDTFMPHGGTLAFQCFHLYNKEAMFKKDIQPLNTKSLTKLKGVVA